MIRNLLLLVCLCAWLPAAAHPYAVEQIENVQSADRTRFTSNPDGILSQAAVARIDSICYGLRQRGAAQVAVVAVDAIAGGDPFTFAYELFSKWGVGRREDSNGVGILLVREQREIRFVTGRGVEGVLPDALCKRIQTNYMLPAFREGDYDRGMVRGVADSLCERGAAAVCAVNRVAADFEKIAASAEQTLFDEAVSAARLIALGRRLR